MIRIKGGDQEPIFRGKGRKPRPRPAEEGITKTATDALRMATDLKLLKDYTITAADLRELREAKTVALAKKPGSTLSDKTVARAAGAPNRVLEHLMAANRGRPKGPNTVSIPARLTPDLVARLDREAGVRGLSRSEAIRALLEEALK